MKTTEFLRQLMEQLDSAEDNSIPERIKTSATTSIPNPYHLASKDKVRWTNLYAGNPAMYQFASSIQAKTFMQLRLFLRSVGLKFDHFYAATYQDGNRNYEHFVGVVGDPAHPLFIWYKNGGYTPGSGANFVYYGGQRRNTTQLIGDLDRESNIEKIVNIIKSGYPEKNQKVDWKVTAYAYLPNSLRPDIPVSMIVQARNEKEAQQLGQKLLPEQPKVEKLIKKGYRLERDIGAARV